MAWDESFRKQQTNEAYSGYLGMAERGAEFSVLAVVDEDESSSFGGPESVAGLKRQCKTLYIRWAVAMQHFEPRIHDVALLLDAANVAADDSKESMWKEAWDLEQCARIPFDRARYYENLKMFDESIRDYQTCVAMCPYDHSIRTRLGLTYHKWNHLQEALKSYLKTAALAPHYQLAWNNAGSIFFNTGFYERAEQCFSRCIHLDKGASIAYNNRGLCNFLAGQGEQAVKDFTTAYCQNHGDKTARSNRAAAHNLLGNYAEAIEDCVSELSRTPSDFVSSPYLHKHMGLAYMRLGDLEKATSMLRLAIEFKKDYRQAYDLLAECLRLQGLNEEAEKVAQEGSPYDAPCGNNESIFSYFLR